MAKLKAGEAAFKAWLNDCDALLNQDLGIDDALAPTDPYSIMDAAKEAFILGTSYIQFVRETFEEDYANREYDEHLRRESEEANASESEEGYDDE